MTDFTVLSSPNVNREQGAVMRAITLWRRLDRLARHYEIPLKAKVVIRRPYCMDEPVESIRQRKDGTVVITTRSRW